MKHKFHIALFCSIAVVFYLAPAQAAHFNPVWEGGAYNPMGLWIVGVENTVLQSGDEIGVFDGNTCVGAGVVTGQMSLQNPLTITASQSDGSGNGFTEGHKISFRFWDTSQQIEMSSITSDFMTVNGTPVSPPPFSGNEDYGVRLYYSSVIPSNARIKISGIGGTEQTAPVEITVEGVDDLDGIAGTAFTLEYAPEIILENVESDFFDTFDAQFQAANTQQPYPDVPFGYPRPLAHNTIKTKFTAARGVATPDAQAAGNVLFTMIFSLKPSSPPGTYPIKLLPTTLYSSEAGYSVLGETLNILVGIDPDKPPTSSVAYPVLINNDVDGNGYSAHADHGAVSFGAYIIQATANPAEGGTIAPSGNVTVYNGQDQEFTITPNDCSSIQDVLINGVSHGSVPGYTFTNVTGNYTIEAKFAIGTYTITVVKEKGEGTVTPFGDSGVLTVNCGTDQTLTITPANCHVIGDVVVDGDSVMDDLEIGLTGSASYTFEKIDTDHIIKVTFDANAPSIIKASAITSGVDPNIGGTISPSGDVEVACGSTQPFTVTPNVAGHYGIVDLVVDGVSKGPLQLYTFENVKTGHTIEAKFTIEDFTIMASAGPGGKISPEGNNIKVPYDGGQTFTITPDSCYQVKDVIVDGTSVGAMQSYPFTNITANHTIEAEFAKSEYTIIASTGQGGKITSNDAIVSGAVKVDCGADKTFNIVPDADNNYYIDDVVVDGQSRGAITTHTFAKVDTDGHTIQANFKRGIIGDINGDGRVDMTDAVLALKILAGIKPANIHTADVNGDNKIGIDEVIFILRKVGGY
ncbi:MAG: hypothetical protein GY749_09195 [Desulfobacteraceae bacterium]|nr:hypothetical protein [Desulfobacteraceae bacterium]